MHLTTDTVQLYDLYSHQAPLGRLDSCSLRGKLVKPLQCFLDLRVEGGHRARDRLFKTPRLRSGLVELSWEVVQSVEVSGNFTEEVCSPLTVYVELTYEEDCEILESLKFCCDVFKVSRVVQERRDVV